MRIASYNIMSGGFDDYDTSSAEPQRLSLLQKAIKTLSADVIGLIDTYRWDEIYSEAELRKLLNYKYAYCINLNDKRLRALGHNNGLTLLSNVAMRPSTITLGTRDAILTKFTGDSPFNLVIAYLDDLSEDARLEQIKVLQPLASDPLAVIGDFNAISPTEKAQAKASFNTFIEHNPQIGAKLAPIVTGMLRAEVIEQLQSWGLKDAGKNQPLPTIPTPLFPAKVDQPFLRIDYCFHSPSLRVSDLRVHYDDVFKSASDHFPISFTIVS